MRIKIGDSRLFFDVEGSKLRPDGPRMREVPTVVFLHGGPGFDHSSFKPDLSPLAEVAQLVYLDHRSHGRSDRITPDGWTPTGPTTSRRFATSSKSNTPS